MGNPYTQGHLTPLDGAPGSGLSLVALTLAACVSSGSPLPDGTPIQQGHVLLLAPYDSPTDTLKPRLEAAGGDPTHLLLVHPLLEDASLALARTRSYAFPQDLDHLASLIRTLNARLVILDPASAIPGLSRCLPALVELARQTNCAILLTRSLRQSPADPLHSSGPASPLLEAARSRLLLAPDPTNDGRQLLLTTKHPLCTRPGILAYDILASEAGIPTIHWLGERDHCQLTRLSTGPIRSFH
ncbi:MAG: AAA family ATPase [Ktedonobacteraceae bacterium]